MKKKTGLRLLSAVLAIVMVMSIGFITAFADGGRVTVDGVTYANVGGNLARVEAANIYGECQILDKVNIDGVECNVIAIGVKAFANSSAMTLVSIPASVTEINAYAFEGCTALQTVIFNGEIKYVGARVFDDTKWFADYPSDFVFASTPKGLNYLVGYKGNAEEIIIPMTVDVIAEGVFEGHKEIKSVVIPKRTTKIYNKAFNNCTNLAEVIIKAPLEYVGRDAFANTAWLNNYGGEFVIVGTYLIKYLGDDEFVYVPNTVKSIGAYCFEGARKINSVRVPISVTNIGEKAFFLFNDNNNDKYAEIYTWDDSYALEYAEKNGLTLHKLALPGDVDLNGEVKVTDARKALRYALKLDDPESEENFVAADLNSSAKVEVTDARHVLRIALCLDSFTSEDLLLMPTTDFEILMAYAEAVRFTIRKQGGYHLKEYQKIDDVNIAPAWFRSFLNNPFKTKLTKESKAPTFDLKQDTEEAIDKIYECDLVNSAIIKDAKCVLSDDHKFYHITIEFNDELDVVDNQSFTGLVFPVLAKEDFIEILHKEESVWYDSSCTEFDFNVNYSGCKIDCNLLIANGGFVDLTMISGYLFEVFGKVNNIKVHSKKDSDKPGTAKRIDTAIYTNFDYYPEGVEFPPVSVPAQKPAEETTQPEEKPSEEGGGLDLAGIGDKLGGVADTIGGLVGGMDLGGIMDTVGGMLGGFDMGGIMDTVGGMLGGLMG
jgi:hypothetical protein